MISAKFLWGNVLLGGKLQIGAKNSNFEIFESALYMKSVSMPLIFIVCRFLQVLHEWFYGRDACGVLLCSIYRFMTPGHDSFAKSDNNVTVKGNSHICNWWCSVTAPHEEGAFSQSIFSWPLMKALKLTIAIIAGKSMAYSYIVLYFYNNKKSSQELVFSSFVHNSQKT